jgi:excisionase family DNA binding protein
MEERRSRTESRFPADAKVGGARTGRDPGVSASTSAAGRAANVGRTGAEASRSSNPEGASISMPDKRRAGCEVRVLWVRDGDVAVMLGVHRSTVWRWLDAGLIPAPRRVGGRTLWSREEVELFARCRSMAEFQRLRRSIGRSSPA